MVHRGPDDEGYFADDHVVLGMRRLSIIDLHTGHQPISNEDGTVWIGRDGRTWTLARVPWAEAETEDFRFWYEELTPEQRVRHTHIIGASGTGKSTLLFNLIKHDVENGEGVAVLDPHGDLIDKICGIIPESRIGDVVLVDPSDESHSVGFNILSAHSDLEKLSPIHRAVFSCSRPGFRTQRGGS